MSESPPSRAFTAVSVIAVILGVLGLGQAIWYAWDLLAYGLFESLYDVIANRDWAEPPWLVALIEQSYRLVLLVLLLLVGLVTSAGALVGGGMGLSGRHLPLRFAALGCILFIVVLELLGSGLDYMLFAATDLAFETDPVTAGQNLGQRLAWRCPSTLAMFVRLGFWIWAFTVVRGMKVTGQDLAEESG